MLHDGECLLCSFSFKKVVRDDTGRKAKTNSPRSSFMDKIFLCDCGQRGTESAV